jgi:ketosteroid isomerase-like protein
VDDPITIVNRFNEAFNRRNVRDVMVLMTDDVLFENTNPPPDGARFVGQDEVRAFWERFFASNPDARFDAEEIFSAGDRVVVLWSYNKMKDGKPWHLRGLDIFRVRDGKVSEKRSYVKG